MKLEAYNTASIRDFWVGFERDVTQQQWKVDMKIHCETPDFDANHTGTFNVIIKDGVQEIKRYQQDAVLKGDINQESSTEVFSFFVPFSQVI